jgi:hypothetical protein
MRLVEQIVNRLLLLEWSARAYMIPSSRRIKTQSFARNDFESDMDRLVKKDLTGQKARNS